MRRAVLRRRASALLLRPPGLRISRLSQVHPGVSVDRQQRPAAISDARDPPLPSEASGKQRPENSVNPTVARLRDWLDLGRNTIESLKISDATRFYETEWPETRKMLIADHRESIEGERKRLKRFVRTRSAILYGLARRRAPLRRVIFAVAFVWCFALLFSIGSRKISDR